MTELPKGNNELLLVVEDQRVLRDMLARMLRGLDYEVMTVESGEKAVEYLRQNQADLVLLDMVMDPGINGRETYERILAFRPGQRAIVVSGFSDSDEIKRIFQLGVSQLVQKPYTLEEIGAAVKGALLGG